MYTLRQVQEPVYNLVSSEHATKKKSGFVRWNSLLRS
jgi:hypothetical protein